MAKNERNAGRKPKYANKSKTISFSIPEDVIHECKALVRDVIDRKAERNIQAKRTFESVTVVVDVTELNTEPVKRIKDLFEKAEFPCGCSIENNLLKRGKGKCKLSKEEHLKNH